LLLAVSAQSGAAPARATHRAGEIGRGEASGGTIMLAQADDPGLPGFIANTPRRRSFSPQAAPFALPTAPITVGPQLQGPPTRGALPGGPTYPPYEKEMVRLAEILGAIHYLRDMCGADEGSLWRDRMEELIEAEDPQPQWRARLVDSFNSGFHGFERTYRTCTPAARRVVELYLKEGQDLSGAIKTRYTN
jgi:uncharacterized protein (TIGR02301 family)